MPREHGEEFSFTNMTPFSLKTNLGFNHSGRWKETVIKKKRVSVCASLSDPTGYLATKVRMRKIYFDSSVKRGKWGGGVPLPLDLNQYPKPY